MSPTHQSCCDLRCSTAVHHQGTYWDWDRTCIPYAVRTGACLFPCRLILGTTSESLCPHRSLVITAKWSHTRKNGGSSCEYLSLIPPVCQCLIIWVHFINHLVPLSRMVSVIIIADRLLEAELCSITRRCSRSWFRRPSAWIHTPW